MKNELVSIIWLRRDLRLEDHAAIDYALKNSRKILFLFIFDKNILDKLYKSDKRVSFIFQTITALNEQLKPIGTQIFLKKGNPVDVFKALTNEIAFNEVITTNDYEPYAIERDRAVARSLQELNIGFISVKDQVIFEKSDILNNSGTAFKIYTPYAAKWREKLVKEASLQMNYILRRENFADSVNVISEVNSLKDIDFIEEKGIFTKPEIDANKILKYSENRDKPYMEGTTLLGVHLRFGTISPRILVSKATGLNQTFINELIWREFFMQILWHFPYVENEPFKPAYRFIEWRNNETEFEKWCQGRTGFPLVDAGMRQLNETGFMHNRVRMVAASFLTKHLLIDWRWGERYFADKLLDYELSSNNGNWQWAAGTGCDAAPYFRIFNPSAQLEKFDPEHKYIRKWLVEYGTPEYPDPMIEHAFARERCLEVYGKALQR